MYMTIRRPDRLIAAERAEYIYRVSYIRFEIYRSQPIWTHDIEGLASAMEGKDCTDGDRGRQMTGSAYRSGRAVRGGRRYMTTTRRRNTGRVTTGRPAAVTRPGPDAVRPRGWR